MHCKKKFKLRQSNTSCCLIEVVTKAGLTVHVRKLMYYLIYPIHLFTSDNLNNWPVNKEGGCGVYRCK